MLQMAASCRIWPRHVAMTASYRKWQRRVANGRALSPMAASCRQWPRHVANGCVVSQMAAACRGHLSQRSHIHHIHCDTPQYRLPATTSILTHTLKRSKIPAATASKARIIESYRNWPFHVANGCLSCRKWLFVTSRMAVCHVANGYVSCSKLLIHPCQTTRTTP